jgi:16S rRNA (guanine966-N2)-methyltransferase
LRIISGQARGRKLFTPGNSTGIRPTSDRAREALFSIIGQRVQDACVLDLYSGTGALGLEALSRGAKEVIFIDNSHTALELTRKNYELCRGNKSHSDKTQSLIVKYDLRRGLSISSEMTRNCTNGFDLIFLDPPYGKGLAEKTLLDIDAGNLCNKNSLVIAEEASGIKLSDVFPKQLNLHEQRQYGDTSFWFYFCEKCN